MDLNSCLVKLCNSFASDKNDYDKIRCGFFVHNLYTAFRVSSLNFLAFMGYIDMIKYRLRMRPTDSLDSGMSGACEGGHLDIIRFFEKKGVSLSKGLNSAAIGGHLHIVKLIVESGGNNDLDWAMRIAVAKGRLDIVKFFISLKSCDLDRLIDVGVKYNRKEMLKFLRGIKV